MNLKQDIVPLLKETWQEFQEDEAGQLGAALAYYAVFSIFPLLILLVAGLGLVLQYWPVAISAQAQILAVVEQNFSRNLRDIVEEILGKVQDQSGKAAGVGAIILLLGASGVFQQLDASFNKIWRVPKKTQTSGILATITTVLHDKLFAFGMVLAVGFLMLISLALTGITQALLGTFSTIPVVGGVVGFAGGLVVTLLLSTLVFALLFKYLPDIRVRWSDVWLGGLITAILWEIAKRLLAMYISYSSQSFSAYGAIGTLLVLMLWVYFSSQILFLGAEFTEVYTRRYGSRAVQPAPKPAPEPPPEKAPAPPPQPAHSTGTVVAATGAGVLVGVLGALVAGLVALIIGARRAAASVARRVTHIK